MSAELKYHSILTAKLVIRNDHVERLKTLGYLDDNNQFTTEGSKIFYKALAQMGVY